MEIVMITKLATASKATKGIHFFPNPDGMVANGIVLTMPAR
jgi:hypothetical protein